MENINTHNLKMVGLEAASENTRNWPKNTGYTEIRYDRVTGDIYTADYIGDPINNWREGADPDIITVAVTDKHISCQRLADLINDRVSFLDHVKAELEKE